MDSAVEDHAQDFLDFLRRDARPILEAGLVSAGVVQSSPALHSAMNQVLEHTISRFMAQFSEGHSAGVVIRPLVSEQMAPAKILPPAMPPSQRDMAWTLSLASNVQPEQLAPCVTGQQVCSPNLSSMVFPVIPVYSSLNLPTMESFHPCLPQPVSATTTITTPGHFTSSSNNYPSSFRLTIKTQSPRQLQQDQDPDYFDLDADSLMLRSLQSYSSCETAHDWLPISNLPANFNLGLDMSRTSGEPREMDVAPWTAVPVAKMII